MPRKKIGTKEPGRVTIRFDESVHDFYLKEAGQHRLDLSEYLRQMIMRGVIAENAAEIQESFKYTASEMQKKWKDIQTVIPDEVVLSLFTVEELLKKVVAEKNIQTYYEAKNSAQTRLKQVKDTLVTKDGYENY